MRQIVSPAGTYFAIGAKGSHSIYLFPPELDAVASQVLLRKESFLSSLGKGKNFPLTWDKASHNALRFAHQAPHCMEVNTGSPGHLGGGDDVGRPCAGSAFGRFMEDGRQGKPPPLALASWLDQVGACFSLQTD